MPAAVVERKTPDGTELERWEKIRSDARGDAGQSYIITAPHNCVASDCFKKLEKTHEPYTGTVAHQKFTAGTAQVVALDETATSAQVEQRLADLDFFANGGYRIQKARFLQPVVETEDD